MTEWKAFTVRIAEQVAEVALTGPGKHNAMGPDFWRELPLLFGELDADPQVRAIVVTGAGRNFSVGLDLRAMRPVFDEVLADGSAAARRTRFHRALREMQEAMSAVAACRTPVVAAVHGACIGGGVDLIAAADIRYASADAKFSVREVKVAIVADVGSLQRLPRIIGEGHFRELAYTGREIDASHAERIGLVNEVVPDAVAVLRRARATAREIAANPPLVVQGIKEVAEHDQRDAVAAGLRYVAAWNSAFLPSADLVEALAALDEGRPPRFAGE
ncbi:crotonase/enoyl-CoA hydratase family protein [Nocardia wallacei]|uniref:crotonase/enoyl-CoA hydratase family protein n=1 Tax=Nocardia wallacei TaxID=480035 RepID=UPI0024570622|nr:crotonase/enoyl-CoA hydratase family protein [Nocardia wallacei]